MEMDLVSFVSGLLAGVIPTAAVSLASLFKMLRATADATVTPIDDRMIDFIEAIAERIVEAKLSDPEDPYSP